MKNKHIFKINIMYLTALTLVAVIFVFGHFGLLKSDVLSSILIQIIVMFAIPLLMYSLLNKKNISNSLKDCGLKKISSKMIGISILLGLVLYFINSFVASTFSSIISFLGYESLSSSTVSVSYEAMFKELIFSCILPGFCEEFLHRGIMLHSQKKHANTKYCLIISSILFGLAHLNIKQFFYAAILGFLMGYVTLVADSIIPSIIIHFMNNFLSNYFFYGAYLNWPFARYVAHITNILSNNVFIFVSSSTLLIISLLFAFKYLTEALSRERARYRVEQIIDHLKTNQTSIIQAQISINEINEILKKTKPKEKKKSCSFVDKVPLMTSIILGSLVTISSFIWGVL